MKILLLGSGGREHALAWKIVQSKKYTKLFVAPGNAGTKNIATNIDLNPIDFESIKKFSIEENITMVIVGPEDPLVHGIYDFFLNDASIKHISVIGPSKKGAKLEGSKEFAKEFLMRYNIPTAKYQSFTKNNLEKGYKFLESLNPPYVLKADGLAGGKGVIILENITEAKTELKNMVINKKFGDSSTKVVIEEFLKGIELSCFVVTDGKNYKILPIAKDYKKIGEGDTGLNTGGMGAISPVPFVDKDLLKKIESRIVKPTIKGLQKDKIEYKGFIFIGIIKVNDDPFVIEYNVRMGDPETEVVIPRIKSDIIDLFNAIANKTLETIDLDIEEQTAVTIMLVSGGYPEKYETDKLISGLETISDALVFHAGTKNQNNHIITNGGRVLTITSFGNDIKQATKKSYQNIKKLHFDKMYFRKDIGFDL